MEVLRSQAPNHSYISRYSPLATEGLATGYYEPTLDQEWYAWKSRDASDKDSLTTFEYYVEGDEIRATSLRLVMEGFELKSSVVDMQEFIRLIARLHEAALAQPIPTDLVEEVLSKDAVERLVNGKIITASKKPWNQGDRKRVTLEFSILAAGRRRPQTAARTP